MDDAFSDGCGDDGTDESCPICRGEVSDEFLALIERAVAEAEKGSSITAEEAIEWIKKGSD
jgi:hypothetical protein